MLKTTLKALWVIIISHNSICIIGALKNDHTKAPLKSNTKKKT